ncbi:MAG TPA: PTS sugar transporter subunit IIA [Polyangiaceae bacterium]|nr:PTS sugar transporter subunit IIA [Polyangiaceae bacterium]
MRLIDILTEQRILVDGNGASVPDKEASLAQMGRLISSAGGIDAASVYRLLMEREQLQSTGIGDGVAIPHASTDKATVQVAGLIICPSGLEFASIDGQPVHILFGVLCSRRATGEHLKTLARISRLLRDASNRSRLIASNSAAEAYALIQTQDAAF